MKKFFLFFFAICQGLISFQSHAQGCWEWENPSLFGSIEVLPSVVVDRNANVYTVGINFTDSIFYGTIMTYDNIAYGIAMIVTKTDSSGNVLWVKSSKYAGVHYNSCLATDPQGNLYVLGAYNGDSLGFDSVTITNPYTGFFSMFTAFLVKYSPSGNVLWAVNVGPTGMPTGLFVPTYWVLEGGLCIDNGGNAYVAGGYNGHSFAIGGTTLYNRDTSGNTTDIFFIKFDEGGNVIWAKSFGGTGIDIANVLVADKNNNVFMAGAYLSDTLYIGSSILVDSPNSFLAKFDSSGNLLAAKELSAHTFISALTIDSISNIYMTGYIDTATRVDSDTLVSYGSKDVFLAKYDSSLHLAWAKSAGSRNFDVGYNIALDTSGNIWFCGEFITGWVTDSIMNFSGHLDTVPFGRGNFIAEYSNSGSYLYSMALGGTDEYIGIAIDGSSNLYLSGDYLYYVSGSVMVSGGAGFFVAKYQSSCPPPVVIPEFEKSLKEILPNISIHPNPASSILTITSSLPITQITITNLVGQTVYFTTPCLLLKTGGEVQVDVSGLPTGIYFIKINGNEVRKFVKE